MPHSGHFSGSTLGEEWTRYERLAELCALAGLTNREAECVLLWCRGMGWAEMGRTLKSAGTNCRRDFWRAVDRIAATFPMLADTSQQAWAKVILVCFRNHLPGNQPHNAPVLVKTAGEWSPAGRVQIITEEDLAPVERQVLRWLRQVTTD